LASQEFTQRGTTTSRRDGPSSLEKSKRSINDDYDIGIEKFEWWETGLGFSFITTPFAIMFAIDAIVPSVRTIS
jgi:hypothetical protein